MGPCDIALDTKNPQEIKAQDIWSYILEVGINKKVNSNLIVIDVL